jgi:hypothetical protein
MVSAVSPRHSPAAALIGLVVMVVALSAFPGAASAHPDDSEPQTLVINANGADVTVTWDAATDELGLLSDVLGLGDGGQFLVFEDGELDEGASSTTPERKLAAAPDAVEAYFADHITVSSAGESCQGELQPLGEELTDGVTITYHCERTVGSATVYADTLMDVDPRYVIAASDASGENRLYRDDAREFTWTLGVEPPEEDRISTVLYGSAVALAVIAVGVYFWRRRRAHAAKS